jgi:DNA repair exonuclease SbcCD nuclease subunit
MSLNDLKSNVRQFLALKKEVEVLTKRQDEIKSRLKLTVESAGETDDRGHVTLKVEDDIIGDVTLTQQRRVSKTLDMNVAENLLKERGIYDKCVKMVPVLQEDAIMSCVYTGELSEADVDAMFPAKISFAFLVKSSND